LLIDRSVRHLPLSGNLLDVGCGNGAFVREARDMGWSVRGIDVDREAIAAGSAAGLPVTLGGVTDLLDEQPEPRFAAITLNHVIEHLHEPVAELQRVRRLLVPGGAVWIATPNADGLAHRMFCENWVGLDPPRHLFAPTRTGMSAVLRSAGFEAITFPAPAPAFSIPLSWMSAALQCGEDPFAGVAPKDRRSRLRLKVLEWLPLLKHTLNDEIVVMARQETR
jgi:SAM-dependent methyltransferase